MYFIKCIVYCHGPGGRDYTRIVLGSVIINQECSVVLVSEVRLMAVHKLVSEVGSLAVTQIGVRSGTGGSDTH